MIGRIVVGLMLVLPATHLAAAETTGALHLFHPDSLAGWEHSAEPAKGWKMEGRTLRGTKSSSPLVSGWTLGNFELRFRWSVDDEGEWKIGLPQVPSGVGGHLLLAKGQVQADFQIPGSKTGARATVAATKNGTHESTLRRIGRLITMAVDGRDVIRATVPQDVRVGLMLSIAKGSGQLSDLTLNEFLEEGDAAVSMFNGQDLTGWRTPGKKDAWGVKDGNLALVGGGGNYIRSEKEYGNFTLSLEYKIRKRGNSGIGIRTARNGWPSSDGMELQIEDGRKLDASATMAIYRNIEPIALAEKTEDWNHAVIKADGRMISAWLNGVLVQQVNTHFLPELQHRPLRGWIGFQDHGAPIEFRNLKVIEAPDGLGLDAWYSPRNEPASRVVLDRLMNPIRLASTDGIRSSAVSVAVENADEVVLADLKGPGGLVRVTRKSPAGQIAMYFDGEAKPRIECPAAQLHQHVPQVCNETNPLLTFLGYEKSLKIVLRNGKTSEYRIEYVSLPPETPVETFRDRTASIVRGMLPAMDYRHFQISHGTYRDNDPLPRATSGNKTIPPGERVPLVSLDGSGAVKWLRLHADAKLLANDDLWLEVTVDGERQPALSAPARYLFPGVSEGRKFHNFLVLNKGGFVNVLPMPYAQGLAITAYNRGEDELKSIGVTVSYDPLTPTQDARRLRGMFHEAGKSSGDASFQGRGRWIGLVGQTPEQETTLSLVTDERPASGWESTSWRQLTGLAPGQHEMRCLSGQTGSLAWCFHLLAPPAFERSCRLHAADGALGNHLLLFYAE